MRPVKVVSLSVALFGTFFIASLIFVELGLPDVRIFYVVSGSMEPNIPVGSLAVVAGSDSYNVGDVVAYRLTVENRTYTILHRIVAVSGDGRYYVKGDAMPAGEYIEDSRIVGKLVAAIPLLGFLGMGVNLLPLVAVLAIIVAATTYLWPQGKGGGAPSYFLIAAAFLILSALLGTRGLITILGKPLFLTIMTALILATRYIEKETIYSGSDLINVTYILQAIATTSTVSLQEVSRLLEAMALL